MGLRPQSHTPFGPVVQGLGGDEVGGHGAEVVIALGDFVLAELGVQQELGHDVAGRLSVGPDAAPPTSLKQTPVFFVEGMF